MKEFKFFIYLLLGAIVSYPVASFLNILFWKFVLVLGGM